MDQLLKKLQRLPDDVGKTIAAEAIHAGAEPVLESAKQKAPVMAEAAPGHAPPGTLRDSLVIKDSRRSKTRVKSAVQTAAGAFKGDTYYGAFVELGHKQGKRKKKGEVDNRKAIDPYPFLAPAFDENEARSLSIISQRMAAGIEAAAAG